MLALRSTPICLTMSRRTSETLTFNMTWSRPSNNGIGDFGVGDQHVFNVARQIDNHRLADPERKKAHFRTAGALHGSGFGCKDGGQERTKRQRDERRKRQGASQHGPHRRLISPALHLAIPSHFCVVVELWMP